MKVLYYIAIIGLSLFELANVYFIMPMPGSQEINSINFSHFIYSNRWIFRAILLGLTVLGGYHTFRQDNISVPLIPLAIAIIVCYTFNSMMVADKMFLQPKNLNFETAAKSNLSSDAVVIGVEINNEAKAYPIRYLSYHHQIIDRVGDKDIIVTYCSVCHTARIFEPKVNSRLETFRLVGMDHFNAMFEDKSTGSWWQQATGVAVAGKLKGSKLPEIFSEQYSLNKWLDIHPNSKLMLPDSESFSYYDNGKYEKGLNKSNLTRTDTNSWANKSLVIGIEINKTAKAYDWNRLKQERIINDVIESTPILLVISEDNQNFSVFKRSKHIATLIHSDSLKIEGCRYSFLGISSTNKLRKVPAYQEYWHSWHSFHPKTLKY